MSANKSGSLLINGVIVGHVENLEIDYHLERDKTKSFIVNKSYEMDAQISMSRKQRKKLKRLLKNSATISNITVQGKESL